MYRVTHMSRRIAGTVVVACLGLGAVAGCSSDDGPDYVVGDCTPADLDGRSVARVWDETLLEFIRAVIPAPTVHARNLFHTSAAMWDAWAAYDPDADGYFVNEKHTADDVQAAREAAISFAAYRLLLWRYATVSDLPTAGGDLDAVMASLCYRTDYDSTEGDDPAALGNRIAAAVIEFGSTDGALEDERYDDSSYRPVNDPMVVDDPGTELNDPNAWQPLSLGLQLSQNGLPIPGNVQTFIGPQWGSVTSFALPNRRPVRRSTRVRRRVGDPETDSEFKQAALEVLRYSSQLDPADGVEIDTSPASLGNNTLVTNDGTGTTRTRSPASRIRRRRRCVPTSSACHRRVLGRRSDVRDPAGPLEPDRQHGCRCTWLRAAVRGAGARARSVGVGCQDLLRAQRRNARRRDRRVGPQGLLRLGASDLDDPVHGRPRPVDRPGRAVVRS